jgi:hypothetical protein
LGFGVELFRKFKWLGPIAAIVFLIVGMGVYANSQIVINQGNSVTLGAGSAPVSECDSSVDIQPILYNDGSNVYIQGFEYDNVDKAACVGYDFETHFVDNSGGALQMYATTSTGSDPYLLRVFAPDSSSGWQLGLGAQPTAEVTVTQISASSFKAIFATPVSLASNLGQIVMAELAHLPVGSFTNGYSQVGSATGNWENSCLVANNTRLYTLDVGKALYQSTTIPNFPTPPTGVGLSQVSATAMPTSGVGWYGLGCSANGQYLAVSGTLNTIAYSSDYGATWQSKSASSYTGTGTVGGISISNDGQIVAIAVGSTPGHFNFWVNGNFWTSTTSKADATYQMTGGRAQTVKVCGNGTVIYGGGGGSSDSNPGLYRWQSSSFNSGGNLASVSPASSISTFGAYIYQIACSTDGQNAVIASSTNSNVYVTRNQFATYYSPNGLSLTNGGHATNPQTVSMSASGQFVAVGTGDSAGTNPAIGVTQYSTDYGLNLTNTSYINHYMQTITVADDGSRLITGGAVTASPFLILGSN